MELKLGVLLVFMFLVDHRWGQQSVLGPCWVMPCPSFPLLSVETGTPVYGNDDFENNLVQVERVAYSRGLSPEAISVMLEFAMSLRMGKTVRQVLLGLRGVLAEIFG